MRTAGFIILLIFSLILTGCVPESENPLSDPSSATIDKRLLGVWVGKMTDESAVQYVHFVEAEKSITEVVLISHQEKRGAGVSSYKMFPTKIGKNQYMSVMPLAPEDENDPEVGKTQDPHYIFARFDISDKGVLKIWVMMDKEAREAVKKKKLKGKIAKSYVDGDVLITDTRENIIKFIEADHKTDIFELMFTFKRYE